MNTRVAEVEFFSAIFQTYTRLLLKQYKEPKGTKILLRFESNKFVLKVSPLGLQSAKLTHNSINR